jgi:cobalt-zinc-cadmium efflux system outer membrane protein
MSAPRSIAASLCVAGVAAAAAVAAPLTLVELEERALGGHPAIARAAAEVRAAEGELRQAGLYPNPLLGYLAEDVPLDGDGEERGRHGPFLAQEIVLGAKRRLDREVAAQEVEMARARLAARRQSVLNTVRGLYARAVAAQRLVEVHGRMAALAGEAVAVTAQLHNTGAADRSDQLAVEVDAELARLAHREAQRALEDLWAHLVSAVGDAQLAPAPLADLLETLPDLEREEWRGRVFAESPELALARSAAERAERDLERARARRTPNLELEGGVLESRERDTAGDRELFAQVGVRLPLFDRHRGSIAAAQAELEAARGEVERVRLSLASRFAPAYFRYRQAYDTALAYRDGILEKAREAHRLLLERYLEMAAAYPQVLVAQRRLFSAELAYVESLAQAHEAAWKIQGLLVPDEPSAEEIGIPATTGHRMTSGGEEP